MEYYSGRKKEQAESRQHYAEGKKTVLYIILFHFMNAQKTQIGSNSRFVAMAEVGSKGEWRLITGKLKGNS